MSMRRRLERLEAAGEGRDCGPDCPPRATLVWVQDGPDAQPVLEQGQPPPGPCPRCGRPAAVTELVVILDPNVYGTADRLREVRT